MRKPLTLNKSVTIMDPVHGFVRVKEPELAVIDTSAFQRLRLIRQLASAYLAYPGANHSRFEHSIGVMHVAGLACSILEDKGYITQDETSLVRLGALMHDVGHGPFSHVLDELIHEKFGISHEDTTQNIVRRSEIADRLSEYGFSPKKMSDLAVGKQTGKKKFLNDIIAGSLSADIMDYLQRDSYYTGAGFGKVTIERIIDSFEVYENRLALQRDALYTFESLAVARYEMFKAVYFHKTVRAAESMILRSFEIADDYIHISDTTDLERYLSRTDESVLHEILSLRGDNQVNKSKELVKRYLSRKLIKCVYERIIHRKERVAEKILSAKAMKDKLRQELASRCNMDPDEIFIDLPTTPAVPYTSDRESFSGLYLVSRSGDSVKATALSLQDLNVVQAISGYMDVLRIYTTEENRGKVEKEALKMLGEEDYTTKISV